MITLAVGPGKVIEQLAAARDHAKQAAARRDILFVGREVAGQVVDTSREKRDLNIGATGVAIMELEASGGVVGFAHWLIKTASP